MGRPKGSLNKNTILKQNVTNVTNVTNMTEPESAASPKKEVPDEIKQTPDDNESPPEILGKLEEPGNKTTKIIQKRKNPTKSPDPPPPPPSPSLSELSELPPSSDKTRAVNSDKIRTDKKRQDQLRQKRRRTTRKVIILRDSSSSSSSSSSEEESLSSDEDASGYTVVRGRKKRRRYNRHKHSENSEKKWKNSPARKNAQLVILQMTT